MSRILRFFAFVFGVFCVGNVLAAGYSCPTYKQYTSCVKGYYMTSDASSTVHNGTPAVGNACRPCSVMGQYNNIDKYTCPGGTAAPVKKTVKVTYVLNGGSGTTPAATTCNFGEACSLNPGTGTSYHRAGYRLVGWSTASSATSGAFSMVLTAKTTVYAVWTRCAEGTYKTASATPASACATMSYGYHGTGCDSSYMACTGQAQCTGTTFCEQHIKQECPDPNSEENRREIFPEEYSGSQMVGGKVISANGRGAITECMALVWYDPDPNVTDGQTVGLHEYVFVDRDTKRYQGEVSRWLYDAVGPGYYLTDKSGCDEGYASYKSVDICPVGAACPGKEKVECDSSNEATVLTETFGLEICTDGNTTSSTGSIKCDSACSNVIGAATWTTPTWSPSTRQVLDKCAINTCSTGYTRSGSASSTAPASYTCSANCNKVTLNGIKNGGSGTTTLYKKTGLATWYSDNACSDVVTKLSPLPTKPNASYAGHYNTSAASGGTQCVAANGTFKTAAACNVSGNTTFYAQYKCDSNYLGSGTRIAGACTGTVRTIYLKSYDGSATHSTIYQKYAKGWYSNSAATNEISKADIPSRDGYTFRGFYTSKQTDLTASGGTGTRRITANGTLPANTTFTSNANLFAAWAHNCIQPSNGTCKLTISDTGTVTYTTKCNAGYYISGAGTYNPTCTPCGDGTYSAGGTATSCTTCPGEYTHSDGERATIGDCYLTTVAGKYVATANANQITCDNTTAYYYPGGTKVYYGGTGGNVPLIKGEWNAVNTGGTCASKAYCPAGTWGSVAGTCDSIPAGSYPGAASGCATKDDAGDYIGCSGYEACSSLSGVSVSGGTYTSAAGSKNSKACKYTAPSKTITGCSTVTTNTVTYTGTAWPATTYGVTATGGYIISGNNTAAATCTQCGTAKYSAGGTATSCSACPTADSGWTATSPAGSSAYTACYEYQTPVNCASGTVKRAASSAAAYSSTISLLSTLKSKAGYYASTTATSCTICPAGSSCAASATAPTTCANWTYAASAGMASCTACPVLTSGWTKANSTGTGWSSHTNCVQISPTPAGCASGNNKQVAASNGATTWGPATVNTELSAKAGYIVSGTTCPICTGATYSAGGTATSCTTCPSIYTSDNTNGKTKNSECKVITNAGKYIATAGDNTQTICPVKHYCPSASVAYGATNSPTACPAADSTTERTTYPADYLNPTRTSFSLQGWSRGLGAITSCMANYGFTNEAGKFNVESVHYNSTTGKYDVAGGKYYTVANPGWYMVDKYGSTYCNTSTRSMYYHNVAECPANSYCPGYSSMPLCSTGTYEDEMGKFACSSLGTGAYTKSPAKSGPATACYLTTTATNFVKTAKAAEEKCTAGGYCAGGTKVNWGSTGGRTPASAGYYVSGTGATSQTACAAGTYTDTTGKTTCTSAVAGTHTTGCQVAASGSSTKTLACTGTAVCATNTYSSAKASACTACATAKGYTNSGTTAAAHAELASCKATCSGGQYVATAGAGCVNVGTGYYGAGGTVGQNATLARNQCPTGQTTIGYGAGADEAGDCGRILHVGDNKLYLRSGKKTTPSLNVLVDGTKFYGNMSTADKTLTSGVDESLRIKNGNTTYSVYDDMVDYKPSSGSATKLDPTINSTRIVPANISASAGVTNWSAVFSYGTLSGISACTEEQGDNFEVDETKNFAAGGSGTSCWCKMTSPATSGWTYITGLGTTCNNKCAYICAQNIGSNRNAPTTRTNMFSSAGVL